MKNKKKIKTNMKATEKTHKYINIVALKLLFRLIIVPATMESSLKHKIVFPRICFHTLTI